MFLIYIDADACPVKDETYKVAARYRTGVKVVANNPLRVPADPTVELVVRSGFGVVDDWIVEQAGAGDIVITDDIGLAARSLEKQALVVNTRGEFIREADIGEMLAMRDLKEALRQSGTVTGGPRPVTAKDRSRFLSTLDEVINAVRRAYPAK